MKIKYLGTAAAEGWPGLFCNCEACEMARKLKGKNIRTRSQAILDDSLLIDFPPDTYMHVLQNDIELSAIKNLIITHSHEDHLHVEELFYRTEGFGHNFKTPVLNIYANHAVITKIQQYIEFSKPKDFYRNVCLHEVFVNQPFEVDEYKILPLKADHKPDEDALIYIIQKGGKTFLYGNDTGYFPDGAWEQIEKYKFNCVSLDCTYVIGSGHRHMGLADNDKVRQRLLVNKNADGNTKFICVHFSHNGKLLHDQLEERAAEIGFVAAYDGFCMEF